jgi:CheY-like chemotaxis protein
MFARIERPGVSAEPGLGIGLALARRLADMHGGTLGVYSRGEGHGTTFTLQIPLSDAAAASPAAGSGVAVDAPVPPLRIVLVEDNHDIAEVLATWLLDLGHQVTVVHTGEAGIAAIREQRPALAICDLGLPDLDGVDVCRHVRTFAADAQPVMVALTGWGREEDQRVTKDAGFDRHLVKPVAAAALLELLKNVAAAQAGQGERTPKAG